MCAFSLCGVSLELHKKALDGAMAEHGCIGSNIANSQTKGYQAQKLSPEFDAVLQECAKTGNTSPLSSCKAQFIKTPNGIPDENGNTVKLDEELFKMKETSLKVDYFASCISHHFKQIEKAITGKA